ncbi:MAG: Protein translocase subunit SecF [Candidatus Nomurabacteria bacterium GW2011_GWF2_35_66]|uniref:Protein-export membrane protein SecF n=1 Tax=Candidatus Nomurabacteria bacterium GW2011_GWE1_35_16 TaxID=1618761 RepID=A0A0G0BBL2_9BACT|nr:MAG: Protein translocase subunit SecF [Candidatus Nomurabacteria bacterium GW2011_GWF1_34_20]KKP63522.1 MAG: Protein translocase subunit SecF [Candidatus Nomurabacteria bacterium GW2011_GWE2_34_25]KKP66714.1 MAG: Protein translocase subunit SecF [Candidatus Nomurabacteria bacterium GW2011_GWE1_35_16]KKP83814.1 MAG: Protein translocase subunit SecF [Candidatus Nomurabacteria bacterium GW2011_GWF2_35_66]HAE36396.1 protein translocase subunit SecF [Candidatus Nomurabacteria bacterium]
MFIIKYKKIFVSISIALVVLSIGAISFFGLNMGIDFKGGSLVEVEYTNVRPEQSIIEASLKPLAVGQVLIQPIGEKGYSIKARDITDKEHKDILSVLGTDAVEKSFNSIGPSVGKELARKSIISFILVSLGIIFWIAFSFRKVSKPVSSWKYGFIAIISLVHDIIIPVGVFAVMSHFSGVEVDTLFVVAVLTILGLSVSDTIVVFDRIRENIRMGQFKTFDETVGRSLNQVFARSIATSSTVIIALLALVFFGPTSTKIFALMLTAGMFFGTYSSIFLASPMLVLVQDMQKSRK